MCIVDRQKIVVINRNVLFNSASYNMIINVTRAGSLTTSSAGITVCSLIVSAAYGLESFRL